MPGYGLSGGGRRWRSELAAPGPTDWLRLGGTCRAVPGTCVWRCRRVQLHGSADSPHTDLLGGFSLAGTGRSRIGRTWGHETLGPRSARVVRWVRSTRHGGTREFGGNRILGHGPNCAGRRVAEEWQSDVYPELYSESYIPRGRQTDRQLHRQLTSPSAHDALRLPTALPFADPCVPRISRSGRVFPPHPALNCVRAACFSRFLPPLSFICICPPAPDAASALLLTMP